MAAYTRGLHRASHTYGFIRRSSFKSLPFGAQLQMGNVSRVLLRESSGTSGAQESDSLPRVLSHLPEHPVLLYHLSPCFPRSFKCKKPARSRSSTSRVFPAPAHCRTCSGAAPLGCAAPCHGADRGGTNSRFCFPGKALQGGPAVPPAAPPLPSSLHPAQPPPPTPARLCSGAAPRLGSSPGTRCVAVLRSLSTSLQPQQQPPSSIVTTTLARRCRSREPNPALRTAPEQHRTVPTEQQHRAGKASAHAQRCPAPPRPSTPQDVTRLSPAQALPFPQHRACSALFPFLP